MKMAPGDTMRKNAKKMADRQNIRLQKSEVAIQELKKRFPVQQTAFWCVYLNFHVKVCRLVDCPLTDRCKRN